MNRAIQILIAYGIPVILITVFILTAIFLMDVLYLGIIILGSLGMVFILALVAGAWANYWMYGDNENKEK